MDTKDLTHSSEELENKSENNSQENTLDEQTTQKKESAAEMILRKFSQRKTQPAEVEKDTIVDESAELQKLAEKIKKEAIVNTVVDEEIDETEEVHEHEEIHEHEIEHVEVTINFSELSKKELISHFRTLLENGHIIKEKFNVESIKSNFYKKHKAEIAELKAKFIENGGIEEEFKFEPDQDEKEFKELYDLYRIKRNEENQHLEKEKHENLEKKKKIIEEIKVLVEKQESLNHTFAEFRELQRRWSEIGLVPQNEVKNLWDNYNYWVERFYEFVKINKELRDLDLKRNLETKVQLCEKAEELLLEENIIKAFQGLQKLHLHWRETGPVPHEKKDEIWERFKEITSTINKKHQDYFEEQKKEQEKNLEAKKALCEKAEELSALNLNSHKEWEIKSKEILEIQKLWKLIGFAPKKENHRIYMQFRQFCDTFFAKKREFYSERKEREENNLQLKTDLCMQAEKLKDSTEWKKTSEIFIELQKQWKTIGPVPRRVSDELWTRFRAACNEFFERKQKYYENIKSEETDNLKLKQDLIEEIKNYQHSTNSEETLEQLKSFQKRWTEIGHVPMKHKDDLQKQYRDIINQQFNKLKIEEKPEDTLKEKIERMLKLPKPLEKVRMEKERIKSKIDKLQSEITLLENNLGFFTKSSKNANSMLIEFNKEIENKRGSIVYFKKQIDFINIIEKDLREKKTNNEEIQK